MMSLSLDKRYVDECVSESSVSDSGGGDLCGRGRVLERLSSFTARSAEPVIPSESSASRRAELEGLEGSAQAALARLAEEQQVRNLKTFHCLSSLLITEIFFVTSFKRFQHPECVNMLIVDLFQIRSYHGDRSP